MEYLNAHLLLMNCLPVTSDMPEAYIGTGAQADNNGKIDREDVVFENSFMLGVRVAETAKIIACGREALADSLPDEYYYDRNRIFQPPRK